MKSFKISDLFITDWLTADKKPALSLKDMELAIYHRDKVKHFVKEKLHGTAGHHSIMLLRLLRKDKKNVAKINLLQAVDCVNDLTFLHTPWYFFPVPSFSFSAGEKRFTAPADKMEDRSFEQLVFADAAFSKYCINDFKFRHGQTMDANLLDEGSVDELIAVLYQTPAEFNDKNILADAKLISWKLNTTQKTLILHTYANIREYIVNTHPNLFPRGEETEEQERHPVYTGKQWVDLMYDLAESNVFPSLQTASKAEVYKALYWLNKKAGEKPNQPKHAES
jgi:hypothetical protein